MMWPLVWRKNYNLLLLKFFTVKAERDQLAAQASAATKKLKKELGI